SAAQPSLPASARPGSTQFCSYRGSRAPPPEPAPAAGPPSEGRLPARPSPCPACASPAAPGASALCTARGCLELLARCNILSRRRWDRLVHLSQSFLGKLHVRRRCVLQDHLAVLVGSLFVVLLLHRRLNALGHASCSGRQVRRAGHSTACNLCLRLIRIAHPDQHIIHVAVLRVGLVDGLVTRQGGRPVLMRGIEGANLRFALRQNLL